MRIAKLGGANPAMKKEEKLINVFRQECRLGYPRTTRLLCGLGFQTKTKKRKKN